MDIEKIIDRFDKYMTLKELNDNKVTNQLGLSVGLLGKSREEGRDLSKKVIEKILNFYTDIEKVWLLTGSGDMIKGEPQHINIEHDNLKEMLCDMFKKGEIVPALIVQQKNEMIHNLYKEIGRLEAKIEELEGKKTSVTG